MQQQMIWTIAVGALLALLGAHQVWGKAHVPLDKVQVCKNNVTQTVSSSNLEKFLQEGACRLPACDFNNIFQTGDDCKAVSVDNDGDGLCDVTDPRAPANTARCFAGF